MGIWSEVAQALHFTSFQLDSAEAWGLTEAADIALSFLSFGLELGRLSQQGKLISAEQQGVNGMLTRAKTYGDQALAKDPESRRVASVVAKIRSSNLAAPATRSPPSPCGNTPPATTPRRPPSWRPPCSALT